MYLLINTKFSSLWQGPYTEIDKTSDVKYTLYRIQIVGTNKTLIVHCYRLKLCYCSPPLKRSLKPDGAICTNQERQSMLYPTPDRGTLSNGTFAEVVASPLVIQPAGYTSTDDIGQTSRAQ